MARYFNGTDQYLWGYANPLESIYPCTLAAFAWVEPVSGLWHSTIGISVSSSDYIALRFDENAGSASLEAVVMASGSGDDAETGWIISARTWYHVAGVFPHSTLRIAYVNGINEAENTTDLTPATLTDTTIGSIRTFSDYKGFVAEPAIWDVALDAAEIMALAQGIPPWQIRPNHLVGFWLPMGDRTDRDYSGRGLHMTPTGTPTWGQDPPQIASRHMRNRYFRTNDWGAPAWQVKGKSPAAAPDLSVAITSTDFDLWKTGVKVVG